MHAQNLLNIVQGEPCQLGSSMADIRQQLSALVGREVKKQIRKTAGSEESPPLVSVIDVVSAITGQDSQNAAVQFRRLVAQYSDVDAHCTLVKFPDSRGRKGQKDTPVADVRGIAVNLV